MAQTVCLTEVSNIHTTEILYSCDENSMKEDIEAFCRAEEWCGEIDFEIGWYEIGEGESGLDEFIPQEEIEAYFSEHTAEETVSWIERMGYEVELIQYTSGTISIDEEEE